MRAMLGLAALAAVGLSAPAEAAIFVGSLFGTITQGSVFYFTYPDFGTPNPTSQSLDGVSIQIDFLVKVKSNFYSTYYETVLPKYVISSTTVSIPSVSSDAAGLAMISTKVTNDGFALPGNSLGNADYSGDENSGAFNGGKYGEYGFGDIAASLVFAFTGGSSTFGPLTGSGSLFAQQFFGEYDPGLSANFTLTSGYVIAGVPEPATWAMMVLGFGAVGAAMRKRQQVAVAYT